MNRIHLTLLSLILPSAWAFGQTNPWLEKTKGMAIPQRAELLTQAVAKKDADGTRLLAAALSDEDGAIIHRAVSELGRRRSAETFDILIEMAPAQERKGGWETMVELHRYPYPESKPWFEKNWNVEAMPARKMITGALAMKAPRDDSFWRLVERTRDPSGQVVWEVGANIHRYTEEKYQRILLALLDHPNAGTQIAACIALGRSGNQLARGRLERKVKHGPDVVRQPAQHALDRLGPLLPPRS